MADYVWARDGQILGAVRTAGADADEVEALPTREIQRLLDRGYIEVKQSVDPAVLASKQDAATAATDAELTTGLAGKQDAATAATDAELAAAQAADDTRLDALEAAPAGEAAPFTDTGTVISSDDTQASWVVGSDRMDRDAADATKNIRAWFNKVKGAFRAGFTNGTQWDDANVGSYSAAFGLNTRASNSYAFASGDNTIASGLASTATGSSTTASGQNSTASGASATASGNYAVAEGWGTQATGTNSRAHGSQSVASRYGQIAFASGRFVSAGDAQACSMALRRLSTDATPILLTADAAAATLTGTGINVLTLPVSRTFKVRIDVAARRTDAQGEMAGFTWEGLVGRDSSGNARIIGSPTSDKWNDVSAALWTIAVSINTTDATNNYVAVTATGELTKTIRWVAKMEWVEVAG